MLIVKTILDFGVQKTVKTNKITKIKKTVKCSKYNVQRTWQHPFLAVHARLIREPHENKGGFIR